MGLLDVFRRTPHPGPPASAEPPPAPVSMEEQVRLAGEQAVALVAAGFVARADAEDHLVQLVAEDPESFPDLDERRTRQIVGQVWRERLAIESTWKDEGDYTPLRAAFDDLERQGVVARMSFTCCQTCGHDEIRDEAEPGARGYTFFHRQDADRLAPAGSELYLAFGAFSPTIGPGTDPGPDSSEPEPEPDLTARPVLADDPGEDALVGAAVVAALEAHGLVVDWDGSAETRIRLPRIDWRKRLPVR